VHNGFVYIFPPNLSYTCPVCCYIIARDMEFSIRSVMHSKLSCTLSICLCIRMCHFTIYWFGTFLFT